MTFFSFLLLGVTSLLFAVPYFRQGGWLYALLLVVAMAIVRRRPSWKLLACAGLLALYQDLVTLVRTGSFTQASQVNSGMLVQLGSLALLILAIEKLGRRAAFRVAGVVALVAAVSVLLEMRGIDLQAYIPSKYSTSQLYSSGSNYYGDNLVRLKGVYAESSALGAVNAGILFVFLYGRWRLRPRLTVGENVLYWATVAATAFVLLAALTKAGLIVFGFGILGIGVSLFLRPNLRTLLRFLGCVGAATAVAVGLAFVGRNQMSDYLRNEFHTVRAALLGEQSNTEIVSVGASSRWEGFQIAFSGLRTAPLGHAPSQAPAVADRQGIKLSAEMSEGFEVGAYGLKNYLCNTVFSAGFVGILGLAILCYLVPSTQIQFGSGRPAARVELACCAAMIFMAVSISLEDRYYIPGLFLLLAAVLGYFGDISRKYLSEEEVYAADAVQTGAVQR